MGESPKLEETPLHVARVGGSAPQVLLHSCIRSDHQELQSCQLLFAKFNRTGDQTRELRLTQFPHGLPWSEDALLCS